MMFQLVALANYSQRLCLKMNTVDNINAASLVSLSIVITTKICDIRTLISTKFEENKTVVSNPVLNVC